MTAPSAQSLVHLVATRLGDLCDEVVFVGGAVRGLLVTDPAVEGARSTDDVDVIVELTKQRGFHAFATRLREHGFREDDSEGAPICRFRTSDVKVDVMPSDEAVLGFSNRWYPHAITTARPYTLEIPDQPSVRIRLIMAPSFVATKLASFANRGSGQLDHRDLEDIIALVDGRPELLAEVEQEPDELRHYIGGELRRLFAQGFADAVRWHIPGDSTGDARLPLVLTTLQRLIRVPRIVRFGEPIRSTAGGEPGATGGARDGPWTYELLRVERDISIARGRPKGVYLAITARLTSHGRTAGTTGDGRDVIIEDAFGRRFPPLYGSTVAEREHRALPGPYESVWPDDPFETVWVYDVPRDARGLRLCLPFDNVELVLG